MPPVPVYVKGGVWTNVEDQILKAAVQKYGTHQWSKVASLLYKKSARQCEVRWREFLDPQLNFDDFTKEEDSKLLLLARRLPNQWRSIAELLGRTAQACIERYNRLLASASSLQLPALNLRVGELNPNADTQVAKPDRDVFDEDEREMLADAKARLLNTQGKKATRGVRERMLEESKRIAELQRRRELKQAGIQTSIKRGKRKYSTEIDYNEDVIYEQEPLPGFYDTSEEDKVARDKLAKFEAMVKSRGLSERTEAKTKAKSSASVSATDNRLDRHRGKRDREWPERDNNDDMTSISEISLKATSKNEGPDTFREINKSKRLKLSAPGSKVSRTAEENLNIERQKLLERITEPSILSKGFSLRDSAATENSDNSLDTEEGNGYNQPEKKLNSIMRKKLLHQLLEALPTPKNDFDIVYDAIIEEENEEIDALTGGGANGSHKLPPTPPPLHSTIEMEKDGLLETNDEEDVSTVYELECLTNKKLPIPEFQENPTSSMQRKYNELVSNAINGTQYIGSAATLQCLEVLDRHIKALVDEHLMDIENCSRANHEDNSFNKEEKKEEREQLLENIRSEKQKVDALRDELRYVKPLVDRNNMLSKRLCSESLPRLSELRTKYYIQYKIYSRETHTLKRRKQELESILASLVG